LYLFILFINRKGDPIDSEDESDADEEEDEEEEEEDDDADVVQSNGHAGNWEGE
jgi:hypothetical protein